MGLAEGVQVTMADGVERSIEQIHRRVNGIAVGSYEVE